MKTMNPKNKIWNKCTICGKFISIDDFANEDADSVMIYPDSHLTNETHEVRCKICKRKDEN